MEQEKRGQTFDFQLIDWFGPLVLASMAVVGLAVGIFNGEITLSQIKSLSSRAFIAITIMLQASNSVFEFLRY